jgi:hypothetical protein
MRDRAEEYQRINPLIEKAIIALAKRYPEPTKENVLHPNTKRLMDIRDKFLEYEDNPHTSKLFPAVLKILIVKNEDPYYGRRLDWLVEMIVRSGWKPRPEGYPNICWKEPQPYGGGYLGGNK